MNDVDDRLRELFADKAAEVPPHLEVPQALRARSRRRIAVNAMLAAVVALGLGTGAVGALRLIERAGGTTPGDGTTSPPSPSPSATIASCAAGQLRAAAQLEGAMGSREGVALVSNDSNTACTLRGHPTVVLLNADGAEEPDVTYQDTAPGWRVDGEPRPAGWPVVTLRPGGVASFRVRWTNWCPDGRDAPLWTIDMGPDGRVDVADTDAVGSPPCLGPSTGPMGRDRPVRAARRLRAARRFRAPRPRVRGSPCAATIRDLLRTRCGAMRPGDRPMRSPRTVG
jgi:hypothetical protein